MDDFEIWNAQRTSSIPFYREQRCGHASEAMLVQPKFVQILTDWYLNIGKPLPSVVAIQSAIRSEPTFIRNFRYRFHLSASTSNKSLDRFRGVARLTENNEDEPNEQMIDFDDRYCRYMDYCFVNNNVIPVGIPFVSQKLVFYYFPHDNIGKLFDQRNSGFFWRPVKMGNKRKDKVLFQTDKPIRYKHTAIYLIK